MTPNEKLDLMLELRDRLNGKCSMESYTCPKFIEINTWECDDCVNIFKGIVDIYKLAQPNPPCPCKWVPDIATSRLEEYIEELKQKVTSLKQS